MATAPDDDDIDDDTIASFLAVARKLTTKDPKWLTTLLPDFSPKASSQAPDLSTFLQGMLSEEKASKATLSDRLEAALSVMTPEQLIQFRSATRSAESATKEKADGPKPGEKLTKPEEIPLPATKKRKWL